MNYDETLKKKIRSKFQERISNLKKDIASLTKELDACVLDFQEDCEHQEVKETLVTKYGPGDNDVWNTPQRCCLICGKIEQGYYDKYSSKIPSKH